MERVARAAEREKGLNPQIAANFGLLALAARCGAARAGPTPATVAADITTLDLGGKG